VSRHTGACAEKRRPRGFKLGRRGQEMNSVRRQELGNELQSSQHLRLQSASHKLLYDATVPARSGKVQRKKPIPVIRTDFLRIVRAVTRAVTRLGLSSRAIFGSRGARAKGCRETWAFAGTTLLPGAIRTQVPLVLTAQARLGAPLGMTVQWGTANQRSG
jgi:hypothetical protein